MMTLRCVNIIAVFLLCQQGCVESAVEECSGDAEYSILGMMLRRHIFKTIRGAPLGDVCLRECYRDSRCQSFNYVISHDMCELNNRTKEARPEDFVPNSDRYYFKRDMNRVRLGTVPDLPAESCKEIKASEGEYAVNGKYWFHFLEIEKILLAYCDMKTGGRFVVCSEHFTEDCFARTIHVGGSMKRLQPFSVPTIWKKKDKEPTSSSRDRRMIMNELLSSTSEIDQPMETDESSSSQLCQPGPSAQPETLAEAEPVQVEAVPSLQLPEQNLEFQPHRDVPDTIEQADPSDIHVTVPNMEFQLHDEDVTVEETADPKLPKKCPSCKVLKDEVASLKGKVTRLQKRISTNQEQWVETFREIHQQKQLLMVNADYVADIYNTLMTTPREELKALENELKQEVPAPLHSMLEKENKDEAMLKHQVRKQKETVICPPTCTEEELQQELARSQPPMSTDERTASGRRVPHCRTCGKPTRGHGPRCQNNDSA